MKDFRYIDGAAILRLDQEACTGCGQCVTVCPHRIFGLQNKKARILDPDGCMECGACTRNCPTQALYVNPNDGCGCAALIIAQWFSRITGRKKAGGCC